MNSLKSVGKLMSGVIDYAGLFPPASLVLERAVQNFIDYQTNPEVWMLSRFIVPAKRLVELSGFEFSGALSFSALGRGGEDFIGNLNLDIQQINNFRDKYGSSVIVDIFEVLLPNSLFNDPRKLNEIVRQASAMLYENNVRPFFEAPFDAIWNQRVDILLHILAEDKLAFFKIRTGGVVPEAFPSLDQLSAAICASRDAEVSFKATAGLHHPIRHYNESVKTKMHGFINVFGAAALAYNLKLDTGVIKDILAEETAQNFIFSDSTFAWKNHSITSIQLEEARKRFCLSFGSCSFDEPREDLKTLGLL